MSDEAAPTGITRGKVLRMGLLAVAIPLVGLFLYITLVLSWSYSDGERAGTLLKFSHKGWLCKTWEGELVQSVTAGTPGADAGISTNIWRFSVRSDSVVQAITAAMGRKVALHYTEHKGVPSSCFGETPYYVDGVRIAE